MTAGPHYSCARAAQPLCPLDPLRPSPLPVVHRDRKDTCRLVAVSLSLRRKHHTVLWHAEHLPSDCFKVVPTPERPGALVLSPNLLLYYSHTQVGRRCGAVRLHA